MKCETSQSDIGHIENTLWRTQGSAASRFNHTAEP